MASARLRPRNCIQAGFSLVELLVVLAIIAILVGLLAPAIQAAREAARRLQCANNLKQMGLALHQYADTQRRFPAGIVHPNHTLWTAGLLPYLEQRPLYDGLDFSQRWEANNGNAFACATLLAVYRCPSSDAPEHVDVQGVPNRVPAGYLAVGSGTDQLESGYGPNLHLGMPHRDGLMFLNSTTRFASLVDGTSRSLAVGEALFRPDVQGPDLFGVVQIVDHWYIGTDGVQPIEGTPGVVEVSEAIGSTGVPMNGAALPIFIDEKEIGFSSLHAGGCQFVFADGHVEFLDGGIDRAIYSGLGTIAGGEVAAP